MGDRSRSRSPPRRSRSRSPPRRDDDRDGPSGGGGGKEKGTACRWNERGFGFIRPSDGGEDLFCHCSQILDGNCLQEGDPVEFVKVYDDRRGKDRAEQVTGGKTLDAYNAPPAGGGYGGGGGGERQLCWDFQKGRCTRGSACKFSHGDADGGGGGGYGDRYDRGYDDRRGGYDDRRGGYDDRRRSPPRRDYDRDRYYEEDRRAYDRYDRRDDRGYDDRRGGYDDRDRGYDDRDRGRDRYDDRRY